MFYNNFAIAIVYCEPGQGRNTAALSKLDYVRWFLFMDNYDKFMLEAIKEAKKAAEIDEVPVGAVIVKNGKIISRAHNLREKKQDATCHAEVLAIQKACRKLNSWRLEGCSIYVTIEPCSMCAGTILQARLKSVVYGAKDPKGGAIESSLKLFESKNINHHPEIIAGVLKDECSSIMSNYFKQKRK